MKILSIDSSAKTASVAVTDGDKLISECFVNAGLTHSRTLMPMVDNALSQADMKIDDIDAFAVTYGAGLLGALLVGVSFAKALAFATGKPLVPVSHIRGHIIRCLTVMNMVYHRHSNI